MPLAFVQVAAPAVVIVLDCLIWLLFGQFVIFPWIQEQMGGKQPWWKRVALKPIAFIERRAHRLVERIKSDAASRFALASPPLARWLHRNAMILEQMSGTIVASNEAAFRAFYTLRHTTIPTMIADALRSVLSRVTVLEARVQALLDARTQDLADLRDTLRQLPWGGAQITTAPYRAFLSSYRNLWQQFFGVAQPYLNTLRTQTVPDILRRLRDLETGTAGGIGQQLVRVRERLDSLEQQAARIILPRIAALELAVQTLRDVNLGQIGAAVLALTTRIVELEQRIDDVIAPALTALTARVLAIETELEQGIAEGLDRFGEHILELERQVKTVIPNRLLALELAVQALVDSTLGDIGAAVLALTQRIVAIEAEIQDRILPGFDLILGRITALEERIDNVLLPRLQALEDLLAPAAFAALVLATMRRVAPNLFCRNVTSTTERICAIDETLWAELLAGTLLFSLILDPKLVIRVGQEVETTIAGAFRTMADL